MRNENDILEPGELEGHEIAILNSNNKVIRVIVVGDEHQADGQAFCRKLYNSSNTFLQTSYNTFAGQHPENRPLNKNYAGIGFGWDGVGFFPPRCHDEATLNQDTYLWDCTNPEHQPKEITE